jgi:hypothetical protein
MVSKKHEAIVFYLLVLSILSLVVVSISFKYYFPDETILYEGYTQVNTIEPEYMNATIFDVPQRIFRIRITDAEAVIDPLLTANVKVLINDDFNATLQGPTDYVVYNGEIETLAFTDVGVAVTFNFTFSALRNRNPIYISLTTVTCLLSLYYFYVTANAKRNEKTEKVEENPELIK